MAEDTGESIVGAYLRYVRECEFVLFNTFLPGEQGEIDVIGMHSSPREVYFAEVTTHLGGMTYGERCHDRQGREEAGAGQDLRRNDSLNTTVIMKSEYNGRKRTYNRCVQPDGG